MDYLVGVVAHKDRENDMQELRDLQPALISPDDGTLGCGGNHLSVLRALQKRLDPYTWAVVLEDDAIPVKGFGEQIYAALNVAPTRIVSLYNGSGYPAQYQRRFVEVMQANEDACWLLHPQLRHAVGYAIHPAIIRPLVVGMETQIAKRYAADDAISHWAMRNREMVGYTNPSLVDHKDGPTVIDYRMHLGHATVPGRKRPRKAHRAGTRSTWTDSCVTVKHHD